jgi:hypothetical protein
LILLATCALLLLAVAVPAGAIVRLPAELPTVIGNPADALADLPIEDAVYEPATHCSKKRRPGVDAFAAWLAKSSRGVTWGSYRCEKWGEREASLHAEGRALDWHLDVDNPADRREAKRLIMLLLAPDRAGNPHALARRMGIEEILWDCSYWGAGMDEFSPYRPCYSKQGKLRRKVNRTVAHRDHIHFGFTKAGAAKRTSFWKR